MRSSSSPSAWCWAWRCWALLIATWLGAACGDEGGGPRVPSALGSGVVQARPDAAAGPDAQASARGGSPGDARPEAGRAPSERPAGRAAVAGRTGGVDAATPESPERGDDEPDAAAPDAVADAATPTPDAVADPGRPNTEFGAKGEASLLVDGARVGSIFFTLLAPKDAQRAHLFVLPEPRGSEGVADYYVSLVMADEVWRTGSYRGALGGRVAFELSTGQRYAAQGAELDVELDVERLVGEQEHYLRGVMRMRVAPQRKGDGVLTVDLRIDTPSP